MEIMEIKDIRLKNLKTVLERKGYSQTELAMRCGLSPSLISQIMTRHRNMGSALARKLEAGLQLREGWFDSYHDLLEIADITPRRTREHSTTYADLILTKREGHLVELFRQMPESEKNNIINELTNKKRDYEKLLDELIAVKAASLPANDSDNANENNE